LEEARGWFPSWIPKTIQNKIEIVKPGPARGKPYAQSTMSSLLFMSYNILAPSLVRKMDYGKTKEEYLDW